VGCTEQGGFTSRCWAAAANFRSLRCPDLLLAWLAAWSRLVLPRLALLQLPSHPCPPPSQHPPFPPPCVPACLRLQLSYSLIAANRFLPEVLRDERLKPMLENMSKTYTGPEYGAGRKVRARAGTRAGEGSRGRGSSCGVGAVLRAQRRCKGRGAGREGVLQKRGDATEGSIRGGTGERRGAAAGRGAPLRATGAE